MDIVPQLQRQFIDYMTCLYREGYLDDQFTQLQKLADESSPDFVYEIVTLFFQDSDKLIQDLARITEQTVVDFNKVSDYAHQLKGSSSSIGASKVKNICAMFRDYCEAKNRDACLTCLQHLQQEYYVLKKKFEYLFKLEREIVNNGGRIPTME